MRPSAHATSVSEPLLTKLQQFRRALLFHGVTRVVAEVVLDAHLKLKQDDDQDWDFYRVEDPENACTYEVVTEQMCDYPSYAHYDLLLVHNRLNMRNAVSAHILATNREKLDDIVDTEKAPLHFSVEIDVTNGGVTMRAAPSPRVLGQVVFAADLPALERYVAPTPGRRRTSARSIGR